MKKIKLTQGKYALVDNEDFKYLNQWKWYARKDTRSKVNFYAIRNDYTDRKKPKVIYMARLILDAPKGMEVDHISGNTLDNRRKNLRICTHAENGKNKKIQFNSTSKYKGVSWNNWSKKWMSFICPDGKMKHLGYFIDKKEAAKAYNKAAKKYYGEFAYLNKI